MKLLRSTSLVFGLFLSSAFAQNPEGDLAKFLPADTLGYVSVRDVSAVLSIDAEGAIRKLLAHPAMEELLKSVSGAYDWVENEEIMKTLDLEPKEIVRMLNGRLVFAIPSLAIEEKKVEMKSGQAKIELDLEPTRGMALFLDIDITQDRFEELAHNFEKLLMEQGKNNNKITLINEEYEGVKIWQYEVEKNSGEVKTPIRFAFRDGLLIGSDKKETVEDLVDRIKNGAPEGDRLADTPSYIESVDQVGKQDFLVHFNVEQFMPLVNKLIQHELEKKGASISEFVQVNDLIEALGLDALKSIFLGLDVEDDEARLAFGFTQESREHGIAELITYADGGVEFPTYFHPGLHSASVSAFDFTKLYHRLMEMISKASPFAHRFLTTQLENIEKYGFPIQNAVLENSDGFLAEMLGYPEGFVPGPDDHPSQVYVLRVKDAQSLKNAVSEYADINAEEDAQEYMNESIYKMPLPIPLPGVGGGSPKVAIAIVEKYAIVGLGDPRMVESVIGHLKNPGETLSQDKGLMTAFDDLPDEHVVGIGWANMADVITNALRASKDMIGITLDDPNDRRTAEQALNELPDVSNLKYFLASKTYRTPEIFVQRTLLRSR